MYQPLADELRPTTLDDVYGQEEILGEGRMLRRMIESGRVPNLIFYGPSGTGKTTVANIIAAATQRTLYKLNATTASTADIREIVCQLDTFMAPNGVLLYLDEIQSFNKKQQQSLLEHIENGKITLIASTTENPYFYIFNAHPQPLHGLRVQAHHRPRPPRRPSAARVRYMAEKEQRRGHGRSRARSSTSPSSCGGDIRKAHQRRGGPVPRRQAPATGSLHITSRAMRRPSPSARPCAMTARATTTIDMPFGPHEVHPRLGPRRGHRTIWRGFLEVGRPARLPAAACCARPAEDIGLAYPHGGAHREGLRRQCPAARSCRRRACRWPTPSLLLATAPKSNSGVRGHRRRAWRTSATAKPGVIPRRACRMSTPTAPGMEREQGYLYPHNFPNHWVPQQYLPDLLKGTVYYHYGDNKVEQAARHYWDAIKGGSDGNSGR